MTDNHFTQVMLCWPTDRAEIEHLNSRLPDDNPKFAPSVDDSVSSCDGCPRRIWIGRQQLELVNSALVRARKLCLYCAGTLNRVLKTNPRIVDVKHPEPPRPRTL